MKEDTTIKSNVEFPVVGVGASAGGLSAFKKFIAAIPADSGIAFVLVQHLQPNHESLLPEILQKVTPIPVLEISDEITIKPNYIYVIPSNKILTANDGVLQLRPRALQKNQSKVNLIIDTFFISLAEVHQTHAFAVVLSGAASDGTVGLKAIKDYGGITFAQDELSATFESMPNSAVQAGFVDFILPPEQIPLKIIELTRELDGDTNGNKKAQQLDDEIFKQIISMLRIRRGTDFTYYKQTTIRRRILRRMALSNSENLSVYLKYLRENKSEQDVLYQDLLIPVTSFFRDPKTYANLSDTIIPLILKNKLPNEPLRIWVAGCSTGEEPYSVAICLKEILGDKSLKVQIFATDINETAIEKARLGVYSKRDTEAMSPQRMQEFFTKVDGNFQVNKNIREMCVFAVHNFLKDAPFSKIDLLTCRNVLIYMEPYLQNKGLTTFHYALNPKGVLLLGKSETTSMVPDLFSILVKNDKIFARKDGPGKFMQVATQQSEKNYGIYPVKEPVRQDYQKVADEIVLSKYTPAGVVVNEAMDILHFRGNTNNYLEQPPGRPSHNLLKMAKNGLSFELRNLIYKAKKDKTSVVKDNIRVDINDDVYIVSIEAIPLHNTIDPCYLILFHESNSIGGRIIATKQKIRSAGKLKTDDKDLLIQQLENDLSQLREDMRSITEDQETTNEELQSANEELLSSSEELQSLNEELETGKEELQSTNEELIVVNQEMISLMEQLKMEKEYAESIVETVISPLIILDKNMRVKSANSAYYKMFRVSESETEGRVFYYLDEKQWDLPALKLLLENILPDKTKFSNFEITHHFSNLGERVMLLNAREINAKSAEKLILITIEDITVRKNFEAEREGKKRFQFIADAMPQKVWTADGAGNINYLNKIWLEYTGLSLEIPKGWDWKNVVHPEDWEKNERLWRHAIETGEPFEIEHRLLDKDGNYRWHLSRGLAFKDELGQIRMWIGTNTEFQDQKNEKEALEKEIGKNHAELQGAYISLGNKHKELEMLNKELESFAYVSSHDLQEPLRKIQTFSTRLLEKEFRNLSENGKNYFLRMQDAAKRMETLIQDLLTFSRVTTTERKYEIADLNKLAAEVRNDFKEVLDEKSATIEIHKMCKAKVIPFQFRQLMQNLIGNSLKFSRPGIAPHITIMGSVVKGVDLNNKKLSPAKEYCHLTVKDNGIGFEPEFSDKIFEVFQRLHGKSEYEGTGIGLAIVKKIVENHNGTIIAKGELNKGATFDIYLPVD